MTYDGSLNFDTKINTKGFNKDIGLLGKTVKKFGKTLALAFGAAALIKFGKQALQVASDLQEVQNVVDVAFGSMAQDINNFAKTALEQFGLSELSAKRYASSIGAMGASMGFASEQNTEMAKTVTALVGDFASFYNIQQDMAATALNAIWTGETETLKRYGILITEVNLQEFARRKGIDKTIAKMTQQEKVMLRYNYVLQATENAQGDFLRTQDTWANQTRILTERWKQFLGLIGQNLINVFKPAIKMLNNLLSVLISATEQFNVFYSAVTGSQIEQQSEVTSGISDSVGEQDDLTDAVKGTNKELKKSVAGFDELNVLQEKTSTGVSNGMLGGIESSYTLKTDIDKTDAAELSPVFEKLLELLSPLQKINFDNLNNSLNDLKKAVKPLTQKLFNGLEWAYYNIFVPLAKWDIEEFLPSFLKLLESAIGLLNVTLDILQPLGKWFLEEFLIPLGKWTGGLLLKIIEQMTIDLETLTKYLRGEEIKDDNVFTTAKTDANSLAEILSILIPGLKNDIEWFKGEDYKENVFTTAKTDAKTLEEFLTQSLKDTRKAFKLWNEWIESNVISSLDDMFWELWKSIFINQDSAIVKMSEGFVNFVNFIGNSFEKLFNFIIIGLNGIVDRINSLSIDVPDWVPEIGGEEFSFNLKKISKISIPDLALGTVVPLSAEFERYTREQSAESDYKELLDEMKAIKEQETVIKFDGDLAGLARVLKPKLDEESKRKGNKIRVVTE